MQLNATAAAKPHETQLVKLHAQRRFVSVSLAVPGGVARPRHVCGPRNWPQCQIGARWLHNFIMTAKLRDSVPRAVCRVLCPGVGHLVPLTCASQCFTVGRGHCLPTRLQDTEHFFGPFRLISRLLIALECRSKSELRGGMPLSPSPPLSATVSPLNYSCCRTPHWGFQVLVGLYFFLLCLQSFRTQLAPRKL